VLRRVRRWLEALELHPDAAAVAADAAAVDADGATVDADAAAVAADEPAEPLAGQQMVAERPRRGSSSLHCPGPS